MWTEAQVEAMVELNDKKRFEMRRREDGGEVQIRAAQGHTMSDVGKQVGEMMNAAAIKRVPFAVHGTYSKYLKDITARGLHHMQRHHIHLAPGLLGEASVTSGMRHDCSVYIWVDVARAVEAGIRFFEAANGVILCEGDTDGYLPTAYFSVVIELRADLAAPARRKQPLVRLLERLFPGCSRVTATKLHGGFSGSLVLQTDSRDGDGRPNEPTVTKFDLATAMSDEVQRTEEISELVGAEAIRHIRGPHYVDRYGADVNELSAEHRTSNYFGAVVLEMAGACWVLPEFFGKLEVELLSTFKKRLLREMGRGLTRQPTRGGSPAKAKLVAQKTWADFDFVQPEWLREASEVLDDLWGHGGALTNMAMKTVTREVHVASGARGFLMQQLRACAKSMVICFGKPPAGSPAWLSDERVRTYEPPESIAAALRAMEEASVIDAASVPKRDKFSSSFVLEADDDLWTDSQCEPLVRLVHELQQLTNRRPPSAAWLDEWRPLRVYQHGDLNAANVLVDVKERVWLIDFAKAGLNVAFHDAAKMASVLLLEYYPIPMSIDDVDASELQRVQDCLGVNAEVAARLKAAVASESSLAPRSTTPELHSRSPEGSGIATSREATSPRGFVTSPRANPPAGGTPRASSATRPRHKSASSGSFTSRDAPRRTSNGQGLRTHAELTKACVADPDLQKVIHMLADASVCEERTAQACKIVDALLWGVAVADTLPADMPQPAPPPLELWQMFAQQPPESWPAHQRLGFELLARVLSLSFELVAKCSFEQREREKAGGGSAEANGSQDADCLHADLHACNFLFVLLRRALSSLRYVDLSIHRKRVAWHTVRRCSDALRAVMHRRPSPPPPLRPAFMSTLLLAEGQPVMLKAAGSGAAHGGPMKLMIGDGELRVRSLLDEDDTVEPLRFDDFSQVVLPWEAPAHGSKLIEQTVSDATADVQALIELSRLIESAIDGLSSSPALGLSSSPALGLGSSPALGLGMGSSAPYAPSTLVAELTTMRVASDVLKQRVKHAKLLAVELRRAHNMLRFNSRAHELGMRERALRSQQLELTFLRVKGRRKGSAKAALQSMQTRLRRERVRAQEQLDLLQVELPSVESNASESDQELLNIEARANEIRTAAREKRKAEAANLIHQLAREIEELTSQEWQPELRGLDESTEDLFVSSSPHGPDAAGAVDAEAEAAIVEELHKEVAANSRLSNIVTQALIKLGTNPLLVRALSERPKRRAESPRGREKNGDWGREMKERAAAAHLRGRAAPTAGGDRTSDEISSEVETVQADLHNRQRSVDRMNRKMLMNRQKTAAVLPGFERHSVHGGTSSMRLEVDAPEQPSRNPQPGPMRLRSKSAEHLRPEWGIAHEPVRTPAQARAAGAPAAAAGGAPGSLHADQTADPDAARESRVEERIQAFQTEALFLQEERLLLDARLKLYMDERKLQDADAELKQVYEQHRGALGELVEKELTEVEHEKMSEYFCNKLRATKAHGSRRYAAGQPLFVRLPEHEQWVNAQVVEPLEGLLHRIEVTETLAQAPATRALRGSSSGSAASSSGGARGLQTLTLELTPFNHGPREVPAKSFSELWNRHCRAMRAQHASIVDALSGRRLDVKEHCVPIEITTAAKEAEATIKRLPSGGGWNRARLGSKLGLFKLKGKQEKADTASVELEGVCDVDALCRWLHDTHSQRIRGSRPQPTSSCVLLTAGPAAGKTCLLSQLVVHSLDLNGAELLPILLKVQELQKLLLSKDPPIVNAFATSWNWIDAYLSIVHGAGSELYRFLRQALMARRVLLLIDGIDEGGHARKRVEQHIVEVLAPQGFVIVVTSRPNGVPEELFLRAYFRRLKLRPLSDAQQHMVIRQRVEPVVGSAAANDLIEYVDTKVPLDTETNHRVTGNPLMLSMVISIMMSRHSTEVDEAGVRTKKVDMPQTITELYDVAASAMLDQLERKDRGDKQGNAAGGRRMRELLEAVFFQAHAAEKRIIIEEHIAMAAIGLVTPGELDQILYASGGRQTDLDEQQAAAGEAAAGEAAGGEAAASMIRRAQKKKGALAGPMSTERPMRLSGGQPEPASSAAATRRHRRPSQWAMRLSFRAASGEARQQALNSALQNLPREWRDARDGIVERVRQDRLPLLSLLSVTPLEMQSSHLSFQEFYTARALCNGQPLTKRAAEPWRWSAWWGNTLRHGAEMGPQFCRGLLKASGLEGSIDGHLELRAKVGGHRLTAMAAIKLLLQGVRSVDMSDNAIATDEIEVLTLSSSDRLADVNLAGNELGQHGARAIANTLAQPNFRDGLQLLDVSRNSLCGVDTFGRGRWVKEGIATLSTQLSLCEALETLSLADNWLGDEGACTLLGALAAANVPWPRSLTSLSLGHNKLGLETCQVLATTLE